MDRKKLVTEAFRIAYEGCKEARLECLPIGDIDEGNLPELVYVAAEIYKQLSSVHIFRCPSHIDEEMRQLLADIIDQAGIKGIIIPEEIEVIKQDEEDEDAQGRFLPSS